MDRYRLNQILDVLLFPVCDPGLADRDWLFEEYAAYRKFQDIQGYGLSEAQRRSEQNRACLRAEERVVEYLMGRSCGNARSMDDLKMLCQLYYPMTAVEEGVRMHPAKEAREAIAFHYIRNLARIARSLLMYRDGVAAIKTWVDDDGQEEDIFYFSTVFNKVEIWNLLERMSVPDVYIAIHAVERGNGMHVLYGQQGNISLADRLLHQKLKKGLAENHIHFNAGYRYETLWLRQMNLGRWKEYAGEQDALPLRECRLLEAALFRCIGALFLEEDGEECFIPWLHRRFGGKIRVFLEAMRRDAHVRRFDSDCRRGIASLYAKVIGGGLVEEYDYLLESIYAEHIKLRTSSEFILLYKSYKYIKERGGDAGFAFYFVQYLRIKNYAFQQVQEKHDMKGLSYFQKYYHAARDFLTEGTENVGDACLEIFRGQSHVQHLKKLEVRIAPPSIPMEFSDGEYGNCRKVILERLYQRLSLVFRAYRRCILENLLGVREARAYLCAEDGRGGREQIPPYHPFSQDRMNVPTLGIVFHFLKARHLNDASGYFCWKSVLEGVRLNAEYRMVTRWNMGNISRALLELRAKIPFISEYIVGIDAASEENAMEPWMFVPAYHALNAGRDAKIEQGRFGFQNVQDMRFTYHVGEEFRHVLSGLRHIDEVLKGLRYQAGDRLGHALALGIDIGKWIRENEVVPIPLGEHMENLLWVWGKNTCEEVHLPIQLEVLEDEILGIAKKLYKHHEELTVRMLYQAYQKKFQEHSRRDIQAWSRKAEAERNGSGKQDGEKRFCYYEDPGDCYAHWTVETLCLTYYCPVFEERYHQITLVPVSESDTALLNTLQSHLIRRTESLGVYVETNPTSNLTIGDFSQMKDHPIFRLSTIGNGEGSHVHMMVNSDDPTVFHTNVENELAYVYYAAEYQGHSKEHVLAWIDQIRQNGIDGSFVMEEKDPDRILMEVEEIIKALEDRKGIRE